jgi:hypothetical protein
MLTLLTATGCRPVAWEICQRLMERQTFRGQVHWIIVDDGDPQQPISLRRGWSLDIARPTPRWQPGENTQLRNLRAGLAAVGPRDRVAIIEDDDFYDVDYLAQVDTWLNSADLVGESHARYYNVSSRRWTLCNNDRHASLCSTAVTGAGLIALRGVVAGSADFIDVDLWAMQHGILYRTDYVVGIKGLPGRRGIGMGHMDDFGKLDPDGAVLRGWCGTEYADMYFQAVQQ